MRVRVGVILCLIQPVGGCDNMPICLRLCVWLGHGRLFGCTLGMCPAYASCAVYAECKLMFASASGRGMCSVWDMYVLATFMSVRGVYV